MGFYVVQCLSGLAQASSLFLVAAGLSIIFGVTRIVNFAHGSGLFSSAPAVGGFAQSESFRSWGNVERVYHCERICESLVGNS
jgi:branched-chain amino acid transport system permease protein